MSTQQIHRITPEQYDNAHREFIAKCRAALNAEAQP